MRWQRMKLTFAGLTSFFDKGRLSAKDWKPVRDR